MSERRRRLAGGRSGDGQLRLRRDPQFKVRPSSSRRHASYSTNVRIPRAVRRLLRPFYRVKVRDAGASADTSGLVSSSSHLAFRICMRPLDAPGLSRSRPAEMALAGKSRPHNARLFSPFESASPPARHSPWLGEAMIQILTMNQSSHATRRQCQGGWPRVRKLSIITERGRHKTCTASKPCCGRGARPRCPGKKWSDQQGLGARPVATR